MSLLGIPHRQHEGLVLGPQPPLHPHPGGQQDLRPPAGRLPVHQWGGHSCLFLEWVDPTDTITTSTRFRTLDGNWGERVTIVTRTVAEIDRVGKAQ